MPKSRFALIFPLAFALLPLGCRTTGEGSTTQSGGNSVGQFKGFTAIDNYVAQHLMQPNSGFTLNNYFASAPNLSSLLGAYVNQGGVTIYQSATPNALNMALWQSLFTGFANDIVRNCPQTAPASTMTPAAATPTASASQTASAPPSPAASAATTASPATDGSAAAPVSLILPLNAAFLSSLSAVCAWPAASAQSDASLQSFWLAVMAYSAPQSEYDAWRDWYLHQPQYTHAAPDRVVMSMLVSMMMNPYFLLAN